MSDDGKGWVSIHRCIQDHWVYEDKPFNYSMAWIDLVLSCNHTETRILFDKQLVTIERGQMITSIRKLGDRWGWKRDKTLRFLRSLEDDGMIVKKSDSRRTLITLVNYGFFQGDGSENRTVIGQSSDGQGYSRPPQTIMMNNVNNDNKENKYIEGTKTPRKRFVPPTLEEVQEYCTEHCIRVDAQRFIDHYTANGWKVGKNNMKDWKAAVRNWGRNQNPPPTKERGQVIERQHKNQIDFGNGTFY